MPSRVLPQEPGNGRFLQFSSSWRTLGYETREVEKQRVARTRLVRQPKSVTLTNSRLLFLIVSVKTTLMLA